MYNNVHLGTFRLAVNLNVWKCTFRYIWISTILGKSGKTKCTSRGTFEGTFGVHLRCTQMYIWVHFDFHYSWKIRENEMYIWEYIWSTFENIWRINTSWYIWAKIGKLHLRSFEKPNVLRCKLLGKSGENEMYMRVTFEGTFEVNLNVRKCEYN